MLYYHIYEYPYSFRPYCGTEPSPIIDDVAFSVKKGDTLAIIGPNGAGKTTLFKALLGVIPYSGTVAWKKGRQDRLCSPTAWRSKRMSRLTVEEFFRLHGRSPYPAKRSMKLLEYIQLDPSILKCRIWRDIYRATTAPLPSAGPSLRSRCAAV